MKPMRNTLEKNKQLSFDDFLGDEISFFNKDKSVRGSHTEREQSLEHEEDCDCTTCFEKYLLN